MFLLTTRLAAWLRVARREQAWKTAEILILRHQLAVLQRQQPPPEAELSGPGTPGDPARRDTESLPPWAVSAGHPGHDPALAPRHRPPPGRQVQTRQDRQASHPPEHQGPGPPAGPREPRLGLPQDPRRTGRAVHIGQSSSSGMSGLIIQLMPSALSPCASGEQPPPRAAETPSGRRPGMGRCWSAGQLLNRSSRGDRCLTL